MWETADPMKLREWLSGLELAVYEAIASCEDLYADGFSDATLDVLMCMVGGVELYELCDVLTRLEGWGYVREERYGRVVVYKTIGIMDWVCGEVRMLL